MNKVTKHSGLSPFPTTSWTLIQKIQRGSERDAAGALEEICRQYWYPLYAFARHRGLSPHDAEDITQILFQNVITHDTIQSVRAEKGRMRTFMLAMLKNLISKKLRHDTAEKRGGSAGAGVSFDAMSAEERYAREPADVRDADALYDRAWASGVLAAAEARLGAEYAKTDNAETFEHLREFLPLGDNATPYVAAAKKLGIVEGALRLQIHRMRKRYGKLIEEEIAQTVSRPDEIKAELEHLMAVVGG